MIGKNPEEIEGLIGRAAGGEAAAFGELYELFADKIFRFIRIRIQNQQQAEDLLQEVFIKAWTGLKTLHEHSNFNAWLYKIAGNAIIDHFRKMGRTVQEVELNENINKESGDTAEGVALQQSDAKDVEQILQTLPPQYREVLELRFLQDFTISETAKILKKTNLSIRLAQHRALKQLKQRLKNNDLEH